MGSRGHQKYHPSSIYSSARLLQFQEPFLGPYPAGHNHKHSWEFHPFQAKELETVVCNLIKPIERRAVLVCKPCSNPYDGGNLQARRIGEQLSKVVVIRALQLIFDQDLRTVIRIFAESI